MNGRMTQWMLLTVAVAMTAVGAVAAHRNWDEPLVKVLVTACAAIGCLVFLLVAVSFARMVGEVRVRFQPKHFNRRRKLANP